MEKKESREALLQPFGPDILIPEAGEGKDPGEQEEEEACVCMHCVCTLSLGKWEAA